MLTRRKILSLTGAVYIPRDAVADTRAFRIGLILPMTGPFSSTGRQIEAAVKLFQAEHGKSAGQRRIELLMRDDQGLPEQSRRLAQELIVNEKIDVLAGFGITPSALAVAPLLTQAKIPGLVMAAATSSITAASPFFIRTSYTLQQSASTMAEWVHQNKLGTVVTLVSDYGPGIDAEKVFTERVAANGGKVLETIRVPARNPDFAPFLQRVRESKPEAMFVFVPSGPATALIKQFAERGLDKVGIRLIGDGGLTDDDLLNEMGDTVIGAITSFHYSAAHDSQTNKAFVSEFRKANSGARPNFMAVGGYDGMRVIYKALEATQGRVGGELLLKAMRGQTFESPRGPVTIDARNGEIIQNIYIRRVERRDGQLWNVEIDVHKAVRDHTNRS